MSIYFFKNKAIKVFGTVKIQGKKKKRGNFTL